MSLKSVVCGGGGGGGPVGGDRDSISAFAIGTGIGVAGLWLYSWRQSSHVSPNALSYLPIALVRKNSFSKIPPKALVTAEAAEVARQRQASTEILAAQQVMQTHHRIIHCSEENSNSVRANFVALLSLREARTARTG